MKTIIYKCDRCKKENIVEEHYDIFDDCPKSWRYINGKMLCLECLNDYLDFFNQFLSEKEDK